MKKAIILIIISLFTLSFFTLNSDAEELKLGFVDLNRILNESDAGKKAVTALQSLSKSKQQLVMEKEDEIIKLRNELKSQSAFLNGDARKDKQELLDSMVKVTERMAEDFEEEIKKKYADFQNNIISDITKVIAKYGKDEGYTAIFEIQASGLIYRPESIDLTNKIIETFNGSSNKSKSPLPIESGS